jgi:predicted enzyme related to lactoylglutathione lyase
MPDRNEYAAGTPSWVDLATPDRAPAKQFYSALFGWQYEDQEGVPYSIATMRGRAVSGMGEMTDQPPAWMSYVTVTDVDATATAAEKAGGNVLVPPMDVMDAGRMAVLADPTGAVLAIWQPKNSIGSEIVNEPNSFSWSELVTPDVDKAAAFYKQVFGWDPQPFEGMEYTVFNNAGEGIAGAMKPPMEGMPPHWVVYFNVADTDATVASAKQLGGTVLAEPFDIPGVGRLAALADPAGAAFSVMTPPAAS